MRSAPLFLLSVMAAWAQTSQSGLDLSGLDKNVSPCSNFYQYACGNWIKSHKIPSDQASWDQFNVLAENNREALHKILEKAANTKDKRSPVEQKIGDYYAACMDERAIDAEGLKPIQPLLTSVADLKSKKDLAPEIVKLQRNGTSALFEFGSTQDARDATKVIASADQGGLSLPDRDYYLKTDAKSVELRNAFVAHVQKMFELAGDSAAAAKAKADTVLKVETALAKNSMDLVERRDPEKVYHKMTTGELAKLTPSFDWPYYLSHIGAPAVPDLNVAVPEFFRGLNGVIDNTSLADWKTYLSWHVLHEAARLLPSKFVNENFAFYGKKLTGAQELQARWKRCSRLADAQLGEALGQKYVEENFGTQGKAKTLQLVHEIEKEMGKDIQTLTWMSPETKKKAMEKLEAVANKIGYPEKWRDYSKLEIKPGDAVGNAERASTFEFQRDLNKIGKPVDKAEWGMTPPTVNAYYDPQMNNINFPAGILQPPFYNVKADDAVNYGSIGAVVGHELTHGFDDEGRQFDAQGNLKEWWTPEDAKAFTERADCIIKEYGNFTAVDDVKLNGKLTLGENAADNGGVRLAYMAMLDALTPKQKSTNLDGFTPAQRFFLGYAQVWCGNDTDEILRLLAQTNPHSPGQFRVNGVLQNMPEFQQAFGCKTGDAMISKNACRVW